jgi:isopentenyl phosphate kinase
LRGAHAADVTGGMRSKVEGMLQLVQQVPHLKVRILSAERPGVLAQVLSAPREAKGGTLIRQG